MSSETIEYISHGLEPIALVIRRGYDEPGIRFFTPPNFSQQVACMKRPTGYKIDAHVHNLHLRQVLFTQEVLFIRSGKVKVNLFSSERTPVGSKVLNPGDIILLCGGGHSIDILEEASIFEVKQGPFTGDADKTRFEE
jgi:hypothetical protein